MCIQHAGSTFGVEPLPTNMAVRLVAIATMRNRKVVYTFCFSYVEAGTHKTCLEASFFELADWSGK